MCLTPPCSTVRVGAELQYILWENHSSATMFKTIDITEKKKKQASKNKEKLNREMPRVTLSTRCFECVHYAFLRVYYSLGSGICSFIFFWY